MCGFHRRGFLRAGNRIEVCGLGSHVDQNEADDGLVAAGGGDTRIHIDVVVFGKEVRAFGCDLNALLTENGVDEAAAVFAVIVVLFNEKRGRVDAVDPLKLFFRLDLIDRIFVAFARDGIDDDDALDVGTAEKTDCLIQYGAKPERLTLFVDFKMRLVKQISRVVEADVTHQVFSEMLVR